MAGSRSVFDAENPFAPISFQNSLGFKTGRQRSERPLFINKIGPCRQACPIGVDIPAAFDRAAKGDMDRALGIYLQENPLPGVCGRVCYHPCERECNRKNFDEPVNIRTFERFLSDHGRVDIKKNVPLNSKKKRIAIVGSGPAGLSAAYHLARTGYSVTLFEAKPEVGGMLRYGIPSYRLPRSILDREIERILSLGIHTQRKKTIGKDLDCKDLESFDAIFISIGLQLGKTLFLTEVPEDDLITGVDFLADSRRGSLEDAGQKTLIIGGGNVAIDVARTLLRLRRGKGNNITLLCPESREQMPALPEEVNEALEEGVTILNGWAPHKLQREKGKLVSVGFYRAEVKIDGETGSVKIIPVGQETQNHRAEKIIMAIGQGMEPFHLSHWIEIKGDRIHIDPFGRTTLPKVFAGGDSVGEKAFVADAIASGKMGALSITCFLEGRDVEEVFQGLQIGSGSAFSFQRFIENPEKNSPDLKKVASSDHVNTLFFPPSTRNHPHRMDPEKRKETFAEVTSGYEPGGFAEEIRRCFNCGTCIDCKNCIDFCPDISVMKDAEFRLYGFDYDYCKGCGICSVACPRNVIDMVGESNENASNG
jgi:2-oxoacid:acceptor oxidoreductase delta subunit (pyruvate/2-ketoisovalerate family)